MTVATAAVETVIGLDAPLDLVRTLGPMLRGSGDPTMRIERDGSVWRAARTPSGAATLRLRQHAGELRVAAWGDGANAALEAVPDLVGLADEPGRLVPRDPLVAGLVRRLPGVRLPRTHLPFDALLPAILEQKVTGREAWRGYRLLIRHISEPAPGPIPLLLPAEAQRVAALPPYEMHRFGIERRRGDLLRRVALAAARLERADRDEAYARMRAIPGIGPWTVAEVGRLAYGDPDAVSVGDFHLPSLVAWAFTGERHADDARMLELLEPYRGQRGRVQRLLELSGLRPPRRGPRLAPRRIEEI
jgi:3-methyladenine DNA glycosylase/8-oxoguanine DNA glycosylase